MSKLGYAQRIKQRIAELEAVIARAQSELNELKVAERVLTRLGSSVDDDGEQHEQLRPPTTRSGAATVADMAVAKLAEHGPQDTPSLLAILQAEWRPDLQQTTLSSTLSRTKQAGRVSSLDGKWFATNQTKEPPEGGSDQSFVGTDISDEGRSASTSSLD